MQTDDLRAPVVEDSECVAVFDADHAALELPGFDRAAEPEGQEERQSDVDNPVYWRRDGRRPSCIPPGTRCI
jgi:hypothetical protein